MTEPGGGVSVVIATRDRPEMANAAAASVLRALRPQDELIVVDSGSRRPPAPQPDDRARVIRLELPGTSRARNAGWRAARNELIAFTDDDCEVSAGWTASIERAFADPSLGFVTGRLVGDREAAIGTATVVGEDPRRFAGVQDPSRLGSGASMALRRAALEQVGGFDEALGPGTDLRAAEDHDLLWRVLDAGWAGAFDPAIVVTHRLWRGRREAVTREFAYGVGAGALAVKLKRRTGSGGSRLRKGLWDEGVAGAARRLVRGYESGAAAALFKAAGVAVGYARASLLRVEDGKFRDRSRRSIASR